MSPAIASTVARTPCRRSLLPPMSWRFSAWPARAWTQPPLAGPAAQALRKLEAAGVERDDSSLIGIVPMVRTVEPAFEAAMDAVLHHTPVAFTYRTAGTGAVATRHVQPWAIASWHGH